MTSRALKLAVAGILLGIFAWWFTQNYEFTRERVRVGYSGEARVNPMYAARLLLERMGKRVTQQTSFTGTEPIEDTGTLILAASRRNLTPATADQLLEWVSAGGRLIVGVEEALDHDVLLDAIGVSAQACACQTGAATPRGAGVQRVTLPDGTVLRVNLGSSPVLTDDEDEPLWTAGGADGIRVMALGWGKGEILLLSTLRPFTNREIGRLDHAVLLWRVTEGGVPGVLIVRQVDPQSFPGWLVRHAPAALAALAGFLLLWLWQVVPRFGPLAPAAAPDRRSLLEHLRAVGRFHAEQQQLGTLVARAREDCLELFSKAAPLARGAEGSRRLKEASRLSRLGPRELQQAFTGPVGSQHEFYLTVRTLARFRQRLAQAMTGRETR